MLHTQGGELRGPGFGLAEAVVEGFHFLELADGGFVGGAAGARDLRLRLAQVERDRVARVLGLARRGEAEPEFGGQFTRPGDFPRGLERFFVEVDFDQGGGGVRAGPSPWIRGAGGSRGVVAGEQRVQVGEGAFAPGGAGGGAFGVGDQKAVVVEGGAGFEERPDELHRLVVAGAAVVLPGEKIEQARIVLAGEGGVSALGPGEGVVVALGGGVEFGDGEKSVGLREVAGLDRGQGVHVAVGACERLHDGGEAMARAVEASGGAWREWREFVPGGLGEAAVGGEAGGAEHVGVGRERVEKRVPIRAQFPGEEAGGEGFGVGASDDAGVVVKGLEVGKRGADGSIGIVGFSERFFHARDGVLGQFEHGGRLRGILGEEFAERRDGLVDVFGEPGGLVVIDKTAGACGAVDGLAIGVEIDVLGGGAGGLAQEFFAEALVAVRGLDQEIGEALGGLREQPRAQVVEPHDGRAGGRGGFA